MIRLAHVMAPGRGQTDLLLAGVVQRLQADAIALAGTVQKNTPRPDRRCDMDLQLLPDGPSFRISEDRGKAARGCRLDGAAIEGAAEWLLRNLDGADLVIINKFGRQEAEGRGLAPVIAEALSRGLPVLAGVNMLNLAAWQAFSDGLSQELPPDEGILLSWCRENRPMQAA